MEQEKNLDIIDDEINLEDIVKILWKWRYFIIGSILLITVLGLFYSFSIPVYYESRSIIHPAKFRNSYINSATEINTYLSSEQCLNDCIAILGKKELLRMLNFQDATNYLQILFSENMKNFVNFKNNILTVKLYSKEDSIKLNNTLTDLIIKNNNTLLEQRVKIYKNKLEELYNYKNISIMITSFDYQSAKVVLRAYVIRKIDNRKKVVIISFFISIVISIILVFVLEFFKSLDWNKIKNR